MIEEVAYTWKCPICGTLVVSSDLNYIKGFKAAHMGMEHSASRKFLEANR